MILDKILSKMIFGAIKSLNWHEHTIVLKFFGKKNLTGNGMQVRNFKIESIEDRPVIYESPADKRVVRKMTYKKGNTCWI